MKLSDLKKKLISVLIFCLSIAVTYGEDWTLASSRFTFRQKGMESGVSSQVAVVLPQLILEQIAEDAIRTIPSQEQLDRELNSLQTQRIDLFLKLSKEIKTRDAFVLTKDNPRQLKKSIKEQNEKIEEIQKQIDENLEAVKEAESKWEKQIKREQGENVQLSENSKDDFPFSKLAFYRFRKEEEIQSVTEKVSLYKNDSSALFTPSDDALEAGADSYSFINEVVKADINGLLNGEITMFGEYISVTVSLSLYPGGKNAGYVTEVGNSSDLLSIAHNIARKLTPKVANSLPVKIGIDIQPEDAKDGAIISVDGVIVDNIDNIIVDAGIHSVKISSPGFLAQTINYSFAGEESFTVKVDLKPVSSGKLNIRLKKYEEGIFYFNALESSKVESAENPYADATVNGRPVLAIFSDKQDNMAFIYINENLAADSNILTVNAKPYNREQNIDKRRKSMYRAYSVLICSLIPTFYTMGNYTAAANSFGKADERTLDWNTKQSICFGISGTAGVWFAVEMVRYLFAANEVLPAQAKIEKK